MSELTSCNYCTFNGIKARAKREGKKVELRGHDVYVDGKHVAWFMELTSSCCC